MAVKVEAILAIEEMLASKLALTWKSVSFPLRKRFEKAIAEENWEKARALVSEIDVGPVIEENEGVIRYAIYASLLYGASRLTKKLKRSFLSQGNADEIVGKAYKMIEDSIRISAYQYIRETMLRDVDRAQEAAHTAQLDSVQKYDPNQPRWPKGSGDKSGEWKKAGIPGQNESFKGAGYIYTPINPPTKDKEQTYWLHADNWDRSFIDRLKTMQGNIDNSREALDAAHTDLVKTYNLLREKYPDYPTPEQFGPAFQWLLESTPETRKFPVGEVRSKYGMVQMVMLWVALTDPPTARFAGSEVSDWLAQAEADLGRLGSVEVRTLTRLMQREAAAALQSGQDLATALYDYHRIEQDYKRHAENKAEFLKTLVNPPDLSTLLPVTLDTLSRTNPMLGRQTSNGIYDLSQEMMDYRLTHAFGDAELLETNQEWYSALDDYIGPAYDEINDVYRYPDRVHANWDESNGRRMEELISSRPPVERDLILWRGVRTGKSLGLGDGLKVGDEIVTSGFLSMSADISKAETWGRVMLEVHVPKGTKNLLMTTNDGENEVIGNNGLILEYVGRRFRWPDKGSALTSDVFVVVGHEDDQVKKAERKRIRVNFGRFDTEPLRVGSYISILKYDPNQPRHPKGHPQGGQWKHSTLSRGVLKTIGVPAASEKITEWEQRHKDRKYEHALIVDANTGRKLVEHTSKHPSQVRFNGYVLDKNLYGQAPIMTHNHPGPPYSLSGGDVEFSAKRKLHEVRVVCRDGSTFSLRSTKPGIPLRHTHDMAWYMERHFWVAARKTGLLDTTPESGWVRPNSYRNPGAVLRDTALREDLKVMTLHQVWVDYAKERENIEYSYTFGPEFQAHLETYNAHREAINWMKSLEPGSDYDKNTPSLVEIEKKESEEEDDWLIEWWDPSCKPAKKPAEKPTQ